MTLATLIQKADERPMETRALEAASGFRSHQQTTEQRRYDWYLAVNERAPAVKQE